MAIQHPELIPSGIDLTGANRDRELFMALNPIVQALSEPYHLTYSDLNSIYVGLNRRSRLCSEFDLIWKSE